MPLMQEDIRQHYEEAWKKVDDTAKDDAGLVYSSPVEDAVLYPIYQQLIARQLEPLSTSLHLFAKGEDCIEGLKKMTPDMTAQMGPNGGMI